MLYTGEKLPINNKRYQYIAFDTETTGLTTDAEIVTIGYAKRYTNGDGEIEILSRRNHTEKQIIKKFVEAIQNPCPDAHIYSFNGQGFDNLLLYSKLLDLFDDYGETAVKYDEVMRRHHVDLMVYNREVLDNYEGLEEMAARYGIQSQADVDGSKVPQMFEQGRIQEIEEYQREDVRVTFKLGEKIREEIKQSSDRGLHSPIRR